MAEPMAETEDNAEKSGGAYQVLARKYRPQTFEDLIGHEAMVKTLKNAFAANRIAHAYILTGVRGVGKTTTARILARALNYVGPNGEDDGPQIDMAVEGRHCRAIAESRHPDVMEMDAASRTGVGDIRELIEGVRYAPVEARYKVYIIDEVHMLSTAAFNALLKTLEEPPPHVKFIFATTEIRKLPVTVLSRCQRFDLRRIDPEVLTEHLASIAQKENVAVDRDGLWMIARAAEGSVRDALSILDQAIVQHTAQGGEAVTADMIRDMLGLADRSSVWDLLEAAMKGDAKAALTNFRVQYDGGAEPAQVLRDLLDLTHLLTRIKAAGPEAASHGPAGEADAERAKALAANLEMNALTRVWSLLMKGLQETQMAPDAAAAGEMALIRLCFAADLPTPDEALKALKKNTSGDRGVSGASAQSAASAPSREPVTARASEAAPSNVIDIHPPLSQRPADSKVWLRAFADVVRLAGEKRDAKLRTELESYVHLVSFKEGKIELRLHDDAPPDLANRLTQRLKEWTGKAWIVSVTSEHEGEETVRGAREREVMEHPMVMKALELFPDARVTAIREPEAPAAPEPDEEEDAPVDPDDDAVAEAVAARQETGKA
ncbi:DNA polymerase III subunit gamma/tau [Hyphococcus luteus]|uniref:DNA polymerase III subunit gamma/tau n=1 Tax=Hyphococcus luteus TaxID=2058213 RepID=A0A2S7K6K0_9PROT|nr:DNA polymerase III subunit gamma/tau [Marinicaulis flavus]PQA88133.1 DNA polymerase III subunit gamma/tau [Marinicaulis flavus]